jgi:hypothetical protein
MENTVVTKFNKIFASPTEKFVCTLGNSYAENYLASGSLKNGFAILSDKRVYFKGICYFFTGKNFVKRHEERVVDVKDVTGTGFIHIKSILLLVLAIIFTILPMLVPILFLVLN